MKPCECRSADPTWGKPYLIGQRIATQLHKQGMRQVKCPKCHLFTVWTAKKTSR